tara:strand:- start:25288 stop:26808 length:1521 start_codon:yes stop_codon:yes gene_type:complete
MKKICLVIPPSPFLLDERVFVQLGVLKIAAVLEEENIGVDVLDLNGVENFLDALEDYIVTHSETHVFGITATTPQMPHAVQINNRIKTINKSLKTIIGGPHVTLMHAAAKREKAKINAGSLRATKEVENISRLFDVLVCGDGELAITKAMDIDTGVIDADDRKSELFLSRNKLKEMPMPARHLVDLDSYHYEIEGHRATSLIAQLGCPFQCTFCSGRNSPFLRNIRVRPVDLIVEEVKRLHLEYGYTGFMFYDDELNVNKKLMIQLMNKVSDLQDNLGVDFRLRGFVKAELFTEEQAKAMYRAGFRWLLTGFESGDDRILDNIKKRASKEDNTRCVEIAKNNNLKVKALMSIGHAGESRESIANTQQWLLDVEPDDFDCTIITTYPGSPYFDEAIKTGNHYTYTSDVSGDKLYQAPLDYLVELDYYKGDPDGGYVSYVWTDHVSQEELVSERDKLEKTVREKLNIRFNPARPGIKYEHSMGMGNTQLPASILRSSMNDLSNEQKGK